MNTLSKGSGTSLVTLTAGDLVVDLAPEIGGSVAFFRMCRESGIVNLMRPMSEEAQIKPECRRRRNVPDGALCQPDHR
jgi:hypothetical protein